MLPKISLCFKYWLYWIRISDVKLSTEELTWKSLKVLCLSIVGSFVGRLTEDTPSSLMAWPRNSKELMPL